MAMGSMFFSPYDSHKTKMSWYLERFALKCKVCSMEATEKVNIVAGTLRNYFVLFVGNSCNGHIEIGKN